MGSKFSVLMAIALSILIIGIVCVSVFSRTAQAASTASSRTYETVQSTTHDITLYGSASQGWGFTQQSMSSPGPTIDFQVGDLYNITLISVDGLTHQFFVDYNGNRSPDGVEPVSQPFSSTTNVLFAPDRTGEFSYYCYVHPSVMYGNVSIVPEFTSMALLIMLIASLLIAVVFKKRKSLKAKLR
jgi:plastocyanin